MTLSPPTRITRKEALMEPEEMPKDVVKCTKNDYNYINYRCLCFACQMERATPEEIGEGDQKGGGDE